MLLPEADPAETPELATAFEDFRRTRGIVSNVMKSFAHAPAGLSAIVELGGYCRYGTDLSDLQREMVILITGRGVDYAWHHHGPIALKAGLEQGQLDEMKAGRIPPRLDPAETVLAEYVLAYSALKGVPAELFARVSQHFTPRQITDVNITSGYYLCLASSIIGMGVEPDAPQVLQAGAAFAGGKA
jgi:4-carboxymuconolactone decarboxylase